MHKQSHIDSDLSHKNELIFDNLILTVEECAALLKVSTKTVYRLARAGELPHKKIGNRFRFHIDELECFMKGGTNEKR